MRRTFATRIFGRSGPDALGRLVRTRIADLLEGSFDQVFALLAHFMINGGQRLNRAGRWPGKGEFAVGHLALVQRERAVAKDDEAAAVEGAAFVFMEIKDDFFVGEGVFGNFHRGIGVLVLIVYLTLFQASEPIAKPPFPDCATPIQSDFLAK